jgi:tetratricopeptide (TPR) repeat protein
MIAEWRQQLYQQSKSVDSIDKWLQEQEWYQEEDEYSILFEKVYDEPSHRRNYIEKCVENARPSWGYIYLANIIAHSYFNVIFTPNFDDQLNEACFIYADSRPVVCAHDSAVSAIRVTSARPKIIKLHGDFLYDTIKNTVRETETLEKNMLDKFMQFAREYGLIVIGYGGKDRSIMDILDMMLRSDGFFPHGVYWCMQKSSKPSKRLQRLMQRDRLYLVEIDDFDSFMAELHRYLGLALPESVCDPYKATTEKMNRFIQVGTELADPIIKEDIAGLEKKIKEFEKMISGKLPVDDADKLIPYSFLGKMEFTRHNFGKTAAYLKKAISLDPSEYKENLMTLVFSLVYLGNLEEALETSQKFVDQYPDDYVGYRAKAQSLEFMGKLEDALKANAEALEHAHEGQERDLLISRSNILLLAHKWEEALAVCDKALAIRFEADSALGNKTIALKKLGRIEEARKLADQILKSIEDKADKMSSYQKYIRACIHAILGDKENMLKWLKVAIAEDPSSKIDARKDPDFEDWWNDPEFQKLVS